MCFTQMCITVGSVLTKVSSLFKCHFLPKGCWDNATEAEKGGRRRERKHEVQVKNEAPRCIQLSVSRTCSRSAFFLTVMRKNLLFLSRLENLGSYTLPYGKWHCLLELILYSMKLCVSKLAVVPQWCCMRKSISGVSSRRKMFSYWQLCIFVLKCPLLVSNKVYLLVHACVSYSECWHWRQQSMYT